MDDVIERHRELISEVAARHGAHDVRIFGSRARGEATTASDLDLLVRMEPGRSLLDLIALEQELERLLGVDVDVLTPESLSPYLRDEVQQEAVPL